MRILLTGFEPFDEWKVNSSWEAVSALGARRKGLTTERLPVDHQAAAGRVRKLIADQRPDICLMTGLAQGETCRLERCARAPGAGGGAPLIGAWPWNAALAAVAATGAPCRLSDDCGRYVCETGYHAMLAQRAAGGRPRFAAFLHVPPLAPDWPLARIERAVEAALNSAIKTTGEPWEGSA